MVGYLIQMLDKAKDFTDFFSVKINKLFQVKSLIFILNFNKSKRQSSNKQ
ncbi:hypothetical protein HNP72_002563 [Sphingobacterium soli]|nr:hypothetical protein [Sphingobacterium soli]